MPLLRWFAVLLVVLLLQGRVQADSEEDYETKQWQEIDVPLPVAPAEEKLQSFYVSMATDNKFFIDLATLNVGSDGVVRYVLVIVTPSGARNVTFEGMRCETRENRIYASGRRDGTWSKSRNSEWSRIKDVHANRHHAVLFLEYFCPVGVIVRDATEAKEALRSGKHPDNKMW
ncbi:CNP1-like family protein [Dechloromonas denitrificans]|uniref:CNP1-like family protein n=1 Tax=Dechloromonas denitrificans TaxID=281362 RepID=UPI001CF90020|nr:CNP1-like family protein [Dechloromonas denitrificans]UCV02942.1 CNP1-like family protein [Dechloromonas denitrificans]